MAVREYLIPVYESVSGGQIAVSLERPWIKIQAEDVPFGERTSVAPGDHTHPAEEVTGLADAVSGLGLVADNDPRLTDARAPTAHNHPSTDITGLPDFGLLPTQGQKNALAGTSGTPAVNNQYVTNADARLTDARAPTAHTHAQSDVTGLAASLTAKQDVSAKGQANGYASLAADGKVPAAQLPAAGAAGALMCRLAADFTNNLVTKNPVPGMAVTLAASTAYSFEFWFYTTAAAATTGIQFGLTFGGTATAMRAVLQSPASTSALAWFTATAFPATFNPTASQGNVPALALLSGTVEVGATGGVLQVTEGSEVAASLTTVLRGSWGRVQ